MKADVYFTNDLPIGPGGQSQRYAYRLEVRPENGWLAVQHAGREFWVPASQVRWMEVRTPQVDAQPDEPARPAEAPTQAAPKPRGGKKGPAGGSPKG